MLVQFDGLSKPVHLDGVWRYPGERVVLPSLQARDHIDRGLARPVGKHRLGPIDVQKPERESEPASTPRLLFNGCEVERFPDREDVVASVIVPMFRSEKVLPALLASLEQSDPTPYELIFVSDGDGQPDLPGKLIVLPENIGFAGAVNAGARHAAGKFICLLNADIKVRRNWLAPMVRLLQKAPDIGAVGNRNLDRNGRIDSIGSEFNHANGHFEHMLFRAPDVQGRERDSVAERDMITAACLLVRRSVWEKLGGLDEEYRIAYFEDSDFCMRLRQAGYRILYCPDSVVEHHKNHSGVGRHRFYAQNMERFRRRWVETGLVDKFALQRGRRVHDGDVVACYIVLNEEEYIQASIESIYPLADRIIIVEGGNDYAVAAGWCGVDKRSTDATVERVKSVADPENKIELIQGAWANKAEQRNAYAERLQPGDWMLLTDGDEVFYEHGLWRLSHLMHKHRIIMPSYDVFWNDFQTVAGGVWLNFPQVKVLRWREGYHYRDHNCPCDKHGRLVTTLCKPFETNEKLYAHYAWVKPLDKLRAKAAYYERQPGARNRIRPNYIDTVFLPFRRKPLEIVRRFGTHPFGGGTAEMFQGKHPGPIKRRMAAGEFDWSKATCLTTG